MSGAEGLPLMLRQLGTVWRIELRRTMWTRRATPLLALACIPVIATALAAVFATRPQVLQFLFMALVLGVGVFFGAAVTHTKLLRGEIVAQTLHFHLLAPVRREVLLVGKYFAGLAGTAGVFVGVTLVCHALPAVLGAELAALSGRQPPGLGNRLVAVVLGCAAYGGLFLLCGALLRNPILLVAGLLGWELLHFVLPPALQAISVAHYLQGVLGDATSQAFWGGASNLPAWACALVLLVFAGVSVALACWRIRRLEVG